MARHPHVPARAALAWLRPRPIEPALGALPPQDMRVLRCHGLDDELLTPLLGGHYPSDLLTSPPLRARALGPHVPRGNLVCGPSALWVHTGLRPPEVLSVASTERPGAWRGLDSHRMSLPSEDRVVLAGVECSTLERAAVDVARTAPPTRAVEAILAAYAAGATRRGMLLALGHCRGGAARGRPRAQRLILSVERAFPERAGPLHRRTAPLAAHRGSGAVVPSA
ncbi:hypothetical protein [Actinomyces gaoshouyii]|uniref:AbiEi antitoxin C-terminal domain-containing protein n=1 Tax=Actinomyces gaoshouyii TaxID=1960083 RepID=A0A8H9HA47_9ACTO|nr:hypothetical protein [Actinomyces gaoshouyii]GGO98038.1 hypothetical protein GCM10011612_12030 [Actinomyces gaoshouyii]